MVNRPAHVGRDQVEQLDGRGSKLPDMEGRIEEQRGDVRAREQIIEVVRGGLQLRHLLFQLIVERRQFFVERLQLFLRGLQLLIARLSSSFIDTASSCDALSSSFEPSSCSIVLLSSSRVS